MITPDKTQRSTMPSLIHFYVLLMISFYDGALAGFVHEGFVGSNFFLDGAASFADDGSITLTTRRHDIRGHAFYPMPLIAAYTLKNTANFSTTFVFAITPSSSSGRSGGDGMAFVISTAVPGLSVAMPGSYAALPGRYLGLVQRHDSTIRDSPFLAIELDTVADPEFSDVDDNHVGIDLSSLTSASSSPAGYHYRNNDDVGNYARTTSFEAMRLSSGNAMQVWVDYDGGSRQLDVTLASVPMDKPFTPLLSYTVDLALVLGMSANTTIEGYVGFSAATGSEHGDSHRILGWSFNVDGPATPLNYSLLPLKRVEEDELHKGSYKKTLQKTLVKWLPAAVSSFAILSGVTACLLLRWWRKWTAAQWNEDWEAELGPRRFVYRDLRRATNCFCSRQLLGKGGFGRVYGGVLAGGSGVLVAVKRVSSESRQGMAQFTAEIIILGRLRHRNLVRLIGYCRHKDELLLVYEHMPNGSLDGYLHSQAKGALNWPQRYHIIKGVASGLLYLHEDWEQVIIHRDIKASNVLLDGEMNGRLGDFGLARLHDHGADAQTTHVAGTRGYIAPELMRFGKATKATDVFAFGAFILEVACGRRPVGLNARGEMMVLVQWVRDAWGNGSIIDTMDPRLDDYVGDEAELVLKLGLLCSHPLPAARPSMRLIMRYLDGDLALPEFPPGYLEIIDVDHVLEAPASVANTITGLSGGR